MAGVQEALCWIGRWAAWRVGPTDPLSPSCPSPLPWQELLMPGGELRGAWAPLSDREVFLLQFGESEETLREGRLVEAKVTWVGRDEVKCRLAHTPIEAVVRRENLTSRADGDRQDLRTVIQRDQAIMGRILALRFEESQRDGTKHHVLELTTKGDVLKDISFWENK